MEVNGIKQFIYSCFRYPEARAIHRKIIFHSGPTNSGKTYHAIQKYLSAKSGVYCGPLKLLAHEIFEKSNAAVSILPNILFSPSFFSLFYFSSNMKCYFSVIVHWIQVSGRELSNSLLFLQVTYWYNTLHYLKYQLCKGGNSLVVQGLSVCTPI